AGSIIVTTVKPDTEAFIDGASFVNQSLSTLHQDVLVQATDEVSVSDRAGAVAAGIVGLGASIDVITIKNSTVAYIGTGATVSAGRNIQVLAHEERDVSSIVLAFAAGFGSVQAAVAVIDVGR